ncbi:MAG: EVE domain-containing protein [Bdellovibrionota bacterium]|nr:EVE domain-containing protein [Bdellovibrionota bacterium]
MKYWLGVVSKEHVLKGVKGGFAQVCHGKKVPLSRMKKDDWLIYYSPGLSIGKSDIQSFTAIGWVTDDEVFQFKMSTNFVPYRRKISYLSSKDVRLFSLKEQLELCQEKSWGFKLRRGLIEISKVDFEVIKKSMVN